MNLDRRPENLRGFFRFDRPLLRRSMAGRFAARADHEMRRPARAGFLGDDAPAGEFDVVRVGAEGQQRRKFSRFRYTLHGDALWYHDSRK